MSQNDTQPVVPAESPDIYMNGLELLTSRRSIRQFRKEAVPEDLLWKVFEACRFAPTARNSQPYYYVVIRDRKKLEALAAVRNGASAPIAWAPMAIAICSDPNISSRHVQDGCIGAYHLALAAHLMGLGTCWIADLDRDDVKHMLGIPETHYVATVTPLGFPDETPTCPRRKEARDIVKILE